MTAAELVAVRPAAFGLAVMVIPEDVFTEAGETVSQLAVVLAENDTASLAGEVVNVICCEGVVELRVTEVALGVTEGGAVPVAANVAFERLKLPWPPPDNTKLTVPEVRPTDGMAAGTAVIMYPSGIVALAVSVAIPARSQLLMPRVSGAPALSVSTTLTGGVDPALQDRLSPSTATPIVGPMYVLLEELAVVEELDAAEPWLRLVVATTWCPLRPSGSVPLVRFKVPVKV